MKKNTLKTLGIIVLSTVLLASTVIGCGSAETTDAPATEVVGAVVETEAAPEATEEVVAESTEVVETLETEMVESTEVLEETEVVEEPEFAVEDMSATKYAKQSVRVRRGPSTDYEQLGSLSMNQEVTVTGCADTGWYRIEYNGEVGYVSGSYLVNEKVAVAAPTAPAQTPATNTTQNQIQNQTWVDSNAANAGGYYGDGTTATTPSTPAVTPSAPTVTPSAPVVDDSNSLGTVGGNWQGPVTDGNGSNETTWE